MHPMIADVLVFSVVFSIMLSIFITALSAF